MRPGATARRFWQTGGPVGAKRVEIEWQPSSLICAHVHLPHYSAAGRTFLSGRSARAGALRRARSAVLPTPIHILFVIARQVAVRGVVLQSLQTA
jgi:hypothetical protein